MVARSGATAARLAGWSLLLAGLPLGALAAVVALVAVAAATGHRVLAAVAGGLALVLCTGGLSWLAAGRITSGRRWRRGLSIGAVLGTLAVVAVVVAGLGYAPAPAYTPYARHVADFDAIRVAIGADQVMLVGESWGGQLIANYLAVHPDRVARAVLSSPGVIWAPAFPDARQLTDAGRRDQQAVVADQPRFLLAHALMNVAGPRAAHALLPDRQMDGVFEAVVSGLDMRPGCAAPGQFPAGSGERPTGLGFWVNALTVRDSNRVADPRPRLREVTAPVLILRGRCDYLAWEVSREYRDLLLNAVLMPVDDAGHRIPADQPELYRQAVRAFLLDEPLPGQPYTGQESPRSGR